MTQKQNLQQREAVVSAAILSVTEQLFGMQVHDVLGLHKSLFMKRRKEWQIMFSVPGDIPEGFIVVVGQRQVTFSWSPPPLANSGTTTSYALSCSPSPPSLPLTTSQSGPLTVDGFTPNTDYTCHVVAAIDMVSGPPANHIFRTLEDSKKIYMSMHIVACTYNAFRTHADSYFQLRLTHVASCLDFQVSV